MQTHHSIHSKMKHSLRIVVYRPAVNKTCEIIIDLDGRVASTLYKLYNRQAVSMHQVYTNMPIFCCSISDKYYIETLEKLLTRLSKQTRKSTSMHAPGDRKPIIWPEIELRKTILADSGSWFGANFYIFPPLLPSQSLPILPFNPPFPILNGGPGQAAKSL